MTVYMISVLFANHIRILVANNNAGKYKNSTCMYTWYK